LTAAGQTDTQPATFSLKVQERSLANPSLLILAGDGIGPEVMTEVKKIIAWFGGRLRL
jgi:hypothetical protein